MKLGKKAPVRLNQSRRNQGLNVALLIVGGTMKNIALVISFYGALALGHGSTAEYVAEALGISLSKLQNEEPNVVTKMLGGVEGRPDAGKVFVTVRLKEIRYVCDETHGPGGTAVVNCAKVQ